MEYYKLSLLNIIPSNVLPFVLSVQNRLIHAGRKNSRFQDSKRRKEFRVTA